jgi:hypothetical protein
MWVVGFKALPRSSGEKAGEGAHHWWRIWRITEEKVWRLVESPGPHTSNPPRALSFSAARSPAPHYRRCGATGFGGKAARRASQP